MTAYKQKPLTRMILASMFLALGIILPFLTGNVQFLGNQFLPMHLPVLICGFVCGYKYGGLIGFITPLFRAVLIGMPPLYPVALVMSFELSIYGLVIGLLYQSLPKNIFNIYVSLIGAMILGRLGWGLFAYLIYPGAGFSFSAQIFINTALVTAIPGIVFQLIFIPILIIFMQKNKVLSGYLYEY